MISVLSEDETNRHVLSFLLLRRNLKVLMPVEIGSNKMLGSSVLTAILDLEHFDIYEYEALKCLYKSRGNSDSSLYLVFASACQNSEAILQGGHFLRDFDFYCDGFVLMKKPFDAVFADKIYDLHKSLNQ